MRVPEIFMGPRRKWYTLAAVSFGLFMIMLDNTVVNVALPTIQQELDTDLSDLQWIVAGYALAFAALMLTGGKLADAYGRRLIFIVGIVIFTLASLWCGLADSGRGAHPGANRAGRGCSADEPRHAIDHRGHVPTCPTRCRDRHLGGCVGSCARDRAARRRAVDRAPGLELDLLREHPGRHRRDRGEPPAHRRVEGRDARPTRSSGVGHVRSRVLRADVRVDRGERVRLELAADRGSVHGRGRCARRPSSCSRSISARRCFPSISSGTGPTPARTR